jgi:hypothetical protein
MRSMGWMVDEWPLSARGCQISIGNAVESETRGGVVAGDGLRDLFGHGRLRLLEPGIRLALETTESRVEAAAR